MRKMSFDGINITVLKTKDCSYPETLQFMVDICIKIVDHGKKGNYDRALQAI
jgi:hypothetical protein